MQVTKSFILLLCSIFCLTTVMAQGPNKINYKTYIPDSVKIINLQDPKQRIKYPKPFTKEISAGIRMPYRGWSVFFDYGFIRRKEAYKKFEYDYMYDSRVITLEIGERFHSKENKPGLLNSLVAQNINYTPGKKNNFYHAKLMFTNKMLLSGKKNKGNIGIHWVMGAGAVIGLQKPYYINVAGVGVIKYTDTLRTEFLTGLVQNRDLLKGFDELEIIPGAILKSGFQFDFAKNYKRISALEIGGTLEYFFNDVDLMVAQDPRKLFAGFYLSYQFGGRR